MEALLEASGAGARAQRVLDDLGMAGPAAGQAPVPLGTYFRLRHRLAQLVQDETCQMSARALLPGSTDFIVSGLPASGSLADAMVHLARAYNLLHAGEYNFVEAAEADVGFFIDDRTFPYTVQQNSEQVFFLMEAMLAFLHALLTLIAPGAASGGLKAIEVRRDPPADPPAHLRFFRVPIEYGAARYSLLYDGPRARRAVPFAAKGDLGGEAICDRIEALCSPKTGGALGEEVRRLVLSGIAEQGAIAAALGVSPATLRRHLSAEGVHFRTLRKRLLHDRARRLLVTGRPVSDIAEELGFSDVRSFNRAFKNWSGQTPADYRGQAAREGGAPVS